VNISIELAYFLAYHPYILSNRPGVGFMGEVLGLRSLGLQFNPY